MGKDPIEAAELVGEPESELEPEPAAPSWLRRTRLALTVV